MNYQSSTEPKMTAIPQFDLDTFRMKLKYAWEVAALDDYIAAAGQATS